MAGVKALRKIELVQEATAGTEVQVKTALWRGTGTLEDQREVVFASEDIGYLSGVDRTYVPKLLGALSLEDTPATFEQLPYLLAMGVENVVAGVAEGSGYLYEYNLPTIAQGTRRTYSIHGGDDQEVEMGTYAFATGLKLGGKPGEAMTMGADLNMRNVDRNQYSASTISFSTSGGNHILDSANGLAGFLVGDKIVVSGASNAGNNSTFTVTASAAGDLTVTETVTTEAAGQSITIRETFTGAALATIEEILFSKGALYIDAVGGTLGATQKSNTFLGMDLSLNTGILPVFTADGQLYFSFVKQAAPELTFTITFEHDSSAVAEKAAWRAQTARKIRMQWNGTALGSAGATYSTKALRIDAAGKWEKFDTLGEQDGNDIVTGTFRARYNSTAALFANIYVCNTLSALT
jgi:hypothetical protein